MKRRSKWRGKINLSGYHAHTLFRKYLLLSGRVQIVGK
jgi:hypothetical protein